MKSLFLICPKAHPNYNEKPRKKIFKNELFARTIELCLLSVPLVAIVAASPLGGQSHEVGISRRQAHGMREGVWGAACSGLQTADQGDKYRGLGL